jgi:hypothetical protein
MKPQVLSILSLTERAKLYCQLKDAVETDQIRPSHSEFCSPILFVHKANGSLLSCIDYRGLNEVTSQNAYPLPHVDDTLNELKDTNSYTHFDLA